VTYDKLEKLENIQIQRSASFVEGEEGFEVGAGEGGGRYSAALGLLVLLLLQRGPVKQIE
jgi:hypothetical protein